MYSDSCLILGAPWWPKGHVPQTTRTVQIDNAAENIGATHPTVSPLVEDLSSLLPPLISQVQPKQDRAYVDDIQAKKKAWNAQVQAEIETQDDLLTPAKVFAELSQWIGPNAIMTVDVGEHDIRRRYTLPNLICSFPPVAGACHRGGQSTANI